MSKIAVIGTGYVGLVSGALLSDFGHSVVCADVDESKIRRLESGDVPIFEPGLKPVIDANTYYKRLRFTTDIPAAVRSSDIIFIAVGTPSDEDGGADLRYVIEAVRSVAMAMDGYKVIVNKSTVPIGTGRMVRDLVAKTLSERGAKFEFDVVSNPEFLREGSAVYDFSHPDRVVIGAESERARKAMNEVYRVLYLNETPFVETNLETAEMIKYAANAFLALKITYINEIANLCEKVGANVQQVASAMGKDGRISPKFLHAGPGYGGSCFPKDTRALAEIARKSGERVSLIETAIAANERQKLRMAEKILAELGDASGKTIAVLGITFKPNTDDMREAPSLVILPELVRQGAKLRVFDPEGEKEGVWRLKEIRDSLQFCKDEYDAISGSDAIVILTEWNRFRNLDFEKVLKLCPGRLFFDLRNIYQKSDLTAIGFRYFGVGIS
jgi:UDPglucose 6-dehydrogenase